jgi:hypothetical protein
MFFKQIKIEGLGCLSYVIGCPKDGRAFVIDPKRDIVWIFEFRSLEFVCNL